MKRNYLCFPPREWSLIFFGIKKRIRLNYEMLTHAANKLAPIPPPKKNYYSEKLWNMGRISKRYTPKMSSVGLLISNGADHVNFFVNSLCNSSFICSCVFIFFHFPDIFLTQNVASFSWMRISLRSNMRFSEGGLMFQNLFHKSHKSLLLTMQLTINKIHVYNNFAKDNSTKPF